MSHLDWLNWLTGRRDAAHPTTSNTGESAAKSQSPQITKSPTAMDWSFIAKSEADAKRRDELTARLKHYLSEVLKSGMGRAWHGKFNPWAVASGEAMIKASAAEKAELVITIQEVRSRLSAELGWDTRNAISALEDALLRKPLPFQPDQTVVLARSLHQNINREAGPDAQLVSALEAFSKQQPLPAESLRHLTAAFEVYNQRYLPTSVGRRSLYRIKLLAAQEPLVSIVEGESWSDVVANSLKTMSSASRRAWLGLFEHCQNSEGTTPSGKWLKTAIALLEEIGLTTFSRQMAEWLPLVDETKPENDPHYRTSRQKFETNLDLLKGLIWCCSLSDDVALSRAVETAARSFYKKVPDVGPRSIKIGNACVYALSAMPGTAGLAQLVLLKVKVKFRAAQQAIEKALRAAALRLGLPLDEIEELSVPEYGMEEVGIRQEVIGEYRAELVAQADGSTIVVWHKSDGKKQKSIPAHVKDKFADELKELKAAAKDIQRMLPAQKARIEELLLAQKRWPVAVWRERYLDHPLVGIIARRMIWEVAHGESRQSVCWLDGHLVDAHDQTVNAAEAATVELWHPIGRGIEEVVAWRQWFERHQIQQPLKQAHREVYLLTDAERRTETYSNRFAAHLIRQHQFNALCSHRGWKNKLRLMVDDAYPAPSRSLPLWGLRAEFWVESAGTEYGIDTNDTGTYLYLATDQVRFYSLDAPELHAHASGGGYGGWRDGEAPQPRRLETIPPLVFSEIMRDVDLFVGVASVGNDPTWADGGPQGRYLNYWQSYSFGDLSASAQTRKDVLERIIPRLKIADRCSFAEKFLVVRGNLRTYKIHLGSGNILMEPNDQYLCIVPDRRLSARGENVFLPFEGDGTLSIILSKALLLAADQKITDPTITRQIQQQTA